MKTSQNFFSRACRLVRDARQLLEGLVEADDPALGVDHAEEAWRVVDHGANEVALALESGGQMLELRELARDEDRLVAVLHDPGLEVALHALDLDLVVPRDEASGVDRLANAVHDLVGHFLRKDVVRTDSRAAAPVG